VDNQTNYAHSTESFRIGIPGARPGHAPQFYRDIAPTPPRIEPDDIRWNPDLADERNSKVGPMKTETDNKGDTSWFRRLLRKPAPKTDVVDANPSLAATPKKPARHQTILVVDDDPLFLKQVRTELENEGFTVLTAIDGCTAIEIVRTQQPHLLVLDVNLPQDVSGVPWNGYRVVSWMQRFDSMKHIPVVMTSAGDPATITRLALNSGATAFFHKRMHQSQLLTLVNHGLLRHRSPPPNPDDTVSLAKDQAI
jgi:CheY-like chemotaxis protein